MHQIIMICHDKGEFLLSKNTDIAVIKDGAIYVLQAGTPIYVKTADICGITGKSNQWIGQLTSQGTVNKTKTSFGGMYEISDTVYSYCRMLEERASDDEADPEDVKIDRMKREAEANLKQSKAKLAKLELEEITGNMHRSEDVKALTEDLIFFLRNALLSLPGRLSTQVAQETDPIQASEIIRKEIYAIMNEMATYQYDRKTYIDRVRARANKEDNADDEDE